MVFEHLSTSNGIFAVAILQFCRFTSRRCQPQNVYFGTTRVFRISLWEFAGVHAFLHFRGGNSLISYIFAFSFLDSCSRFLFSLCAFHHVQVSTLFVSAAVHALNLHLFVSFYAFMYAVGHRGFGGALSNEAPPHTSGKRTCNLVCTWVRRGSWCFHLISCCIIPACLV